MPPMCISISYRPIGGTLIGGTSNEKGRKGIRATELSRRVAPYVSMSLSAMCHGGHGSVFSMNCNRNPPSVAHKPRSIVLWNLWNRQIDYEDAWKFQKSEANEYATSPDNQTDRLILLQHPSVYTLGTGSTEENLKFDISEPVFPTFRTERGGEVTYHGPGQLVMYPVLNLRDHQQDLHWYLRQLEEVVIIALREVSGLEGERVEGLTGVWVSGCKVAAIGVRATRWITYHGLALNVITDLEPFSHIVPCGISDRPVGSVMSCLTGQEGYAAGFSESEKAALLEEYSHALIDSFCEVFNISHVEAAEWSDGIASEDTLSVA